MIEIKSSIGAIEPNLMSVNFGFRTLASLHEDYFESSEAPQVDHPADIGALG
jgi:hypothetical protein